MACNLIYDFIDGTRIELPTIARAGVAGDDGRYGARAILVSNAATRALVSDHIRILSELRRAAPIG